MRLIAHLLLAVSCAWTGAASAADPACAAALQPFSNELFAKAQPRDRGMLWSLSKDGRVSYLLGSTHVGKAEWMAAGPQVRQALRESDVVAFELDPLDAQVQKDIADGAAKVRRKLEPAVLARLQAAWDASCLGAASPIPAGAPELGVMTLMAAEAMRDGISPLYGQEILLSIVARGFNKQVVSLESAREQLDALLARDDAEAEGLVKETLDSLDKGELRAMMRKTVDIWERGDIAELERYESWCGCVETESERRMLKRLLDDRNPGLAARVDALHARGRKVFAAIGALHMTGPTSILKLLEQRGYTVHRLH